MILPPCIVSLVEIGCWKEREGGGEREREEVEKGGVSKREEGKNMRGNVGRRDCGREKNVCLRLSSLIASLSGHFLASRLHTRTVDIFHTQPSAISFEKAEDGGAMPLERKSVGGRPRRFASSRSSDLRRCHASPFLSPLFPARDIEYHCFLDNHSVLEQQDEARGRR